MYVSEQDWKTSLEELRDHIDAIFDRMQRQRPRPDSHENLVVQLLGAIMAHGQEQSFEFREDFENLVVRAEQAREGVKRDEPAAQKSGQPADPVDETLRAELKEAEDAKRIASAESLLRHYAGAGEKDGVQWHDTVERLVKDLIPFCRKEDIDAFGILVQSKREPGEQRFLTQMFDPELASLQKALYERQLAERKELMEKQAQEIQRGGSPDQLAQRQQHERSDQIQRFLDERERAIREHQEAKRIELRLQEDRRVSEQMSKSRSI